MGLTHSHFTVMYDAGQLVQTFIIIIIMARQDDKRPDGLTLILWQRGKPLTWDVTVAHTLADSYVSATAR